MPDSADTVLPPSTDLSHGPFVYFDIVPTFGTLAGVIQVELAARIIHAAPDGQTTTSFVGAGHLRCSPVAARQLLDALQRSLQMFQEMAEGSAPTGVAVN